MGYAKTLLRGETMLLALNTFAEVFFDSSSLCVSWCVCVCVVCVCGCGCARVLLPRQHVDVAALLIRYNACVNASDKWAFTPLHEASQKGRTQLCALLLAHGARRHLPRAVWS